MCSGVRKSGCPMPRLMMSRPCAASAFARASTAKAFSSPMRSKAAMVFSMGPGSCRRKRGRSSPDQTGKIKPLQSVLAAEPAADIAPDLGTDERVGIVAEIHATVVVERAGRKFVGAPMCLHRLPGHVDDPRLFVPGVFGCLCRGGPRGQRHGSGEQK